MNQKKKESRLTDYTLGELSWVEAEAFREVLQRDPELRKEAQEQRELVDLLALGYGAPENAGLTQEQREGIFRASEVTNEALILASARRVQWRSYAIGIGSAAAALGLMLVVLKDYRETNPTTEPAVHDWARYSNTQLLSRFSRNDAEWQIGDSNVIIEESASSAQPSVKQALKHEPREFREATERRAEQVAMKEKTGLHTEETKQTNWKTLEDPSPVRVPLVCGNANWSLLSTAIERGEKIHPVDIRSEEIMNAVSYQPPSDIILSDIQAGLEVVYCPWNADHVIASVLVHSKSVIKGLEVGLSMGDSVERYRLIGYSEPSENALVSPVALDVPEGYSHMVLYELELSERFTSGEKVVSLHLKSANEQFEETSITSSFARTPWQTSSTNTQLALCSATWAHELRLNTGGYEQTRELLERLSKKTLNTSARALLKTIGQHTANSN